MACNWLILHDMFHFQGYIKRTIFNSTDFAVVEFETPADQDSAPEVFTAVGPIPKALPSELIELHGDWTNHPKYGKQFKVDGAMLVAPTTAKGVEEFLRHYVKGIGPIKAKKLSEAFGDQLPAVIEASPQQLCQVPGITEQIMESIVDAWKERRWTRKLTMFLSQLGVGFSWVDRIYKRFGLNAIEIINSNPYRLVDVRGIGFIKADEIAMKLGWKKNSEERTQAVLRYLVEKHAIEGHVYVSRDALLVEACKECEVPESLASNLLDTLIENGQLVQDTVEPFPDIQVHMIYLPWLYKYERGIADHIHRLKSSWAINVVKPEFVDSALADWESKHKMTLTDKQRQAIRFALTEKVSVLTGGPGTGKTAATKAIVSLTHRLGWAIALASPTGRAAKHMESVAGAEAKTIHRLLAYKKINGKWEFTHNKNNPLPVDLLIVDESSMLDVELAFRLLDAVHSGCSIVFIGDDNQLPSIGPGKVLGDLIKSKSIPVTVLDKIHRQAEQSTIIRNAHLILQGKSPMFPPRLKGEYYQDSFFFEAPLCGKSEDVEWVKKSVAYLCQRVIPEELKLDPFRDVQVLAPMKNGPAGVNALNTLLQNVLNPYGKKLQLGFKEFRKGDRIMITKNNYELDVYNGDVGIVNDFDIDNQRMHIVFPDRQVLYSFEDAQDDLQLAYCQTVHKVQGGEFPVVIFVLLKRHFVMLQRNLVYTGATRPKEKIFFIGSRTAMQMAIRNNDIRERNTFLSRRLQKVAV